MALGIYNRFTSNSVAASGFLKGCVSILTGRSLLTNAERSVKCWEEKNLQVKLDIKELNESLLGNLKRTRTAKASTLLKIFDAVQTNQDFEIAENALLEFRKGINTPKDSLPMVVIRSCLRLDRPDKALTIAINKRKYGVFPSANVYNVIMDGYLSKGHYKGVVRTYQQLLMDELQPNVNSYSLAVLGHILLDFDGGYDTAIKLAKECLERNPQNKRSRRPVLAIIDQSMKNGDREKVKELLDIISDHEPYKKVS
jgi:pentatricopeptide repeat protein